MLLMNMNIHSVSSAFTSRSVSLIASSRASLFSFYSICVCTVDCNFVIDQKLIYLNEFYSVLIFFLMKGLFQYEVGD